MTINGTALVAGDAAAIGGGNIQMDQGQDAEVLPC
jgi:hypothetical protein